MKTHVGSLATLRTVVLYLPVLMLVAFLAFVAVPTLNDSPERSNPSATTPAR